MKTSPIHLWIHVKRFKFELKGNDLAKTVLSDYEWWTDGIGSILDKFALSVDAVHLNLYILLDNMIDIYM